MRRSVPVLPLALRMPSHPSNAFFLFPLMLLLLACSAEETVRPPNILLIVADDLGFDDLGREGAQDSATPNLDRLAAESTRFDRFYTADATCSPTRASLLTGRYPQRFGYRFTPRGLPREITTLPELLHHRGYATHHVGKWHLGDEPASVRPNAQGFDSFFGFLHSRSLTRNGPGYHDPLIIRDEGSPEPLEGHLTEILTNETIRLIESASTQQPWLINLWYFAPHAPIQPPGRRIGKAEGDGEAAYHELVGAMDAGIGRILEALEEAGQSERTVVVFLSDNGSPRPLHNRPLFGGKSQFFEGGTRVPFLVRLPGHDAPRRVDQIVSSLDVYPTLAALAGAELLESVDGVDLSSILRGDEGSLPERTLFWESRRYVLPLLSELVPSPLIRATTSIDHGTDFGALDETGRWLYAQEVQSASLFDLDEDATGSRNVLREHPEIAAELVARVEAWSHETERIPLQISAHGGASWDGEVARFDDSGQVDLSGWDVLRTPGGGTWALSLGVERHGGSLSAEPLVSQAGVFSLGWDQRGRLRLRMGGVILSAAWPTSEGCHSILVTATHERRRRAPYVMYGLFVDGAIGEIKPGSVLLDPPDLGAPTVIGPRGTFRGRVIRPVILNTPLVGSPATERLARQACAPPRGEAA